MASLPERITIPITLDIAVRYVDSAEPGQERVRPLSAASVSPYQPLDAVIGEDATIRVAYLHRGGSMAPGGGALTPWLLIGANLAMHWNSQEFTWEKAVELAVAYYGTGKPFYVLTQLRRVA